MTLSGRKHFICQPQPSAHGSGKTELRPVGQHSVQALCDPVIQKWPGILDVMLKRFRRNALGSQRKSHCILELENQIELLDLSDQLGGCLYKLIQSI